MGVHLSVVVIILVYLAMCLFTAAYSQRMMGRGKVHQGTESRQAPRR